MRPGRTPAPPRPRLLATVREKAVVAAFLVALAVFLTVEPVVEWRRVARFRAHGVPVEATVTGVEMKRYSGSNDVARLQVAFAAGGRRVATTIDVDWDTAESYAARPSGRTVPLLYLPEEPERTAPHGTRQRPTTIVANAVLVLLLIGAVAVLLRAIAAQRREERR